MHRHSFIKTIFISFCFLAAASAAMAQVPTPGTVSYLPSYYTFRDEMNNDFEQDIDHYKKLYEAAVADINAQKSGLEKTLSLLRCKYVLGNCYLAVKDNDSAGKTFDEAIAELKKLIIEENAKKFAETWFLLGQCISQNCIVKPTSYALGDGTKIQEYAKKALAIDPAYGAAEYLKNNQYAFLPAPLNNYKKALESMNALLESEVFRLDYADKYNIYCTIAYVYMQKKDRKQAEYWTEKALKVFPRNTYMMELIPKE